MEGRQEHAALSAAAAQSFPLEGPAFPPCPQSFKFFPIQRLQAEASQFCSLTECSITSLSPSHWGSSAGRPNFP